MKLRIITIIFLVCIIFVSCFREEVSIPKPKTYFRLDVPKPKYQKQDTSILPFTFEYPDYGKIEIVESKMGEKNWFNIDFTNYGCKLYVSYKQINNDSTLKYLVDDSYNFVVNHKMMLSGVMEKNYADEKQKVYGVTFDIKGTDVASSYQFYLTDSTKHFIRGALYFNQKPNNDSLSPIINRVTTDINHMISTFRWR